MNNARNTQYTSFITLVDGTRFYPEAPIFDVGVICHSLGMQVRFNGQCMRFYSVAEHSVLVSRIMEVLGEGDPMEGLFHDACEAYIGDVASPIKYQYLPDYRNLEHQLEAAMRLQFGLPEETTPICKVADTYAIFIEANELLPDQGAALYPNGEHVGITRTLALDLARAYDLRVQTLDPVAASSLWIQRYWQLNAETWRH